MFRRKLVYCGEYSPVVLTSTTDRPVSALHCTARWFRFEKVMQQLEAHLHETGQSQMHAKLLAQATYGRPLRHSFAAAKSSNVSPLGLVAVSALKPKQRSR